MPSFAPSAANMTSRPHGFSAGLSRNFSSGREQCGIRNCPWHGRARKAEGESSMSFRKQIPKPRAVFDDPEAHFDFLTLSSDVDFEGQHFNRKEACRARPDGNVARSDLKKLDEQITECI